MRSRGIERIHAALLLAALLSAAGCYPTTTRPDVVPAPEVASIEVDELMPAATRLLALALDADSFPVRRTEPQDGWLETEWFDVETRQPVKRRPLGPGIVRLRGLVEPGRPNHSVVRVQVLYRPLADPSRTEIDLDVEVPADHPVAVRVRQLLNEMALAGTPRLP